MKVKTFKRKEGYFIILEVGFFNPFKERELGVIVPEINILPKIGIKCNKSTEDLGRLQFLGFDFGFLNFIFRVSIHSFHKVRYIDGRTLKIKTK